MKEFKITAEVTASVEMIIKAESKEEAEQIFGDNIMLTAGIADLPEDRLEVMDDGISEMGKIYIEQLKDV